MSIFVPQFDSAQDTILKAIATGQQYAAGLRALENNKLLNMARQQLSVEPEVGLMTLATLDPSMANAALNVYGIPFEQQMRTQQEMRLAEGVQNQVRQEERLKQQQEFTQKLPLSDIGKQLVDQGYTPGTPEYIAEYRRIKKFQEDIDAKRAANAGTKVNINNNIPKDNIALNKVGENKLFSDVLGITDQIQILSDVVNTDPETIRNYTLLPEQVKNSLFWSAEKLGIDIGPQASRRLSNLRELETFTEQVQTAIRLNETATSATDKELERIMRKTPNKNQTPQEFVQKGRDILGVYQRQARTKMEMLRQGINPNHPMYQELSNRVFEADSGNSREAKNAFAKRAYSDALKEAKSSGMGGADAEEYARERAINALKQMGMMNDMELTIAAPRAQKKQ